MTSSCLSCLTSYRRHYCIVSASGFIKEGRDWSGEGHFWTWWSYPLLREAEQPADKPSKGWKDGQTPPVLVCLSGTPSVSRVILVGKELWASALLLMWVPAYSCSHPQLAAPGAQAHGAGCQAAGGERHCQLSMTILAGSPVSPCHCQEAGSASLQCQRPSGCSLPASPNSLRQCQHQLASFSEVTCQLNFDFHLAVSWTQGLTPTTSCPICSNCTGCCKWCWCSCRLMSCWVWPPPWWWWCLWWWPCLRSWSWPKPRGRRPWLSPWWPRWPWWGCWCWCSSPPASATSVSGCVSSFLWHSGGTSALCRETENTHEKKFFLTNKRVCCVPQKRTLHTCDCSRPLWLLARRGRVQWCCMEVKGGEWVGHIWGWRGTASMWKMKNNFYKLNLKKPITNLS